MLCIPIKGGKAGQPVLHWPALRLTRKNAEWVGPPRKIIVARIPDPPRIRAGPRIYGLAPIFFFFFLHFVLKKLSN